MLSSYKRPGTKQGEKYHLTYTIRDFYNEYKKDHPNGLTRQEFTLILKEFLEKLREEIVVNRYRFKLPFRMGYIRIKKYRNKGDLNAHRINWAETKRLNKKVYHLNLHSNRCYFRWIWDRIGPNDILMRNRAFYMFKPSRKSTRYLAHHIKECANNPEMRDYDCLA